MDRDRFIHELRMLNGLNGFARDSFIIGGGALLLGGYIKDTRDVDLIVSNSLYDKIPVEEKDGFFGKYKKFYSICEASSCNIFGKSLQELKENGESIEIDGSLWYYQKFEDALDLRFKLLHEIMIREHSARSIEEANRLFEIRQKKLNNLMVMKSIVL